MDPELVLSLLSGRESVIPQLQQKDDDVRTDISSQNCPECGQPLHPRLPSNPARIFRGTRLNYEGVCLEHGVILP